MPNQRDVMVKELELDGWVRDYGHRTGKYWAFKKPDFHAPRYFLGKSGALRFSNAGVVKYSFPAITLREALLKRKEERGEKSLSTFMNS